MKQLILVCLLFFSTYTLKAQTTYELNNFLRNGGAELASLLAHPTNNFISAEWHETYSGSIILKIKSKDSWTDAIALTEVEFSRSGYAFTGLRVINDSDSGVAFMMVSLAKEMINELLGEVNYEERGVVAKLEQQFGESIREMNGEELTLVALSLAFVTD